VTLIISISCYQQTLVADLCSCV